MSDIWKLWSKKHGIIDMRDITTEQWEEIKTAAAFRSVSGCKADELVANCDGTLWLSDSTDQIHAVDPLLFVAVRNALGAE